MTIGINGYGAYLPRLRLSRKAVVEANDWIAPGLRARGTGTRTMANWDEDSVTMAVAAARDCLVEEDARGSVRTLLLASSTLPFAERSNAGIVRSALRLDEEAAVLDLTGSQNAAASGLSQALKQAVRGSGNVLLLSADARTTRAGSSQELDYGDGAAAIRLGADRILAEFLGEATLSADFVDRFRLSGSDVDYHWEERWIRDEGIGKLVPRVIGRALERAGIDAAQVDHFIFPGAFAKIQSQLAGKCGMRDDAVVDPLAAETGDTGLAHGPLMLAHTLEHAAPGAVILLAQFGSGAQAFVFRTTDLVTDFKPGKGVGGWIARGIEETRYTRFLAYKNQLPVERGMRGEQDLKTAMTTAWRHRDALAGLVAGRCRETGDVHYPPSRLSYTPGAPAQDTQEPHPLTDRLATVLSWSAEYLSFHLSPPHQYGQVDFDGGGRILMDFTDVAAGDIAAGTRVEMVFRIKDADDRRGFKRYFWKATPIRGTAGEESAR